MTLAVSSKIFLGRYRVAAEEMGAVGEPSDRSTTFQGEEIDSGKKVRIELIPVVSLKTEVRQQLEVRAGAAKKLNHVNIQRLYDFGVQDQQLVYVREISEGTLLSDWVRTHGPMPVAPVLRIAAQVVSALGSAGLHRILHHAINPKNVMLVPGQTTEGQWPLVKVLHFERTVGGAFSQDTPGGHDDSLSYVSPEQLGYGVVDFGSEVYSLGATMWFLLTGAPPVMTPEGMMTGASANVRSADDPLKAIPERIRALLTKMLSVNPSARPRDPIPFYNQLQTCLTEMGPRASVPRRLTPPTVSSTHSLQAPLERRIPIRTLATIGLCLGVTLAAMLLVRGYMRSGRTVKTASPIGSKIVTPSPPTRPASAGEPVVTVGTGKPDSKQSPVAPAVNVTLVSYTPMVGKPGEKDFKIATLAFKMEASSRVQVTDASFYIDSAPFTEGSAQKLPITLFVHTGVFLGPPGTTIDASHPIERTVWLKSQENLSPNWQLAYDQSENATFRWTIGGQRISGSAVKPLHKAWSTSRSGPEVRRAEPAKPE